LSAKSSAVATVAPIDAFALVAGLVTVTLWGSAFVGIRIAGQTYLAPAVAVLGGWALLGETPPGLALAGGALCIAGVYIATRR
jgi:drug/metabolite transporter (DMT)-like permease